jgi:glutamine amidotransferase PdxT
MGHPDSVRLLAESISPLREKFGDRLTLARERNCVQWSFEGNAAIVEFQPGDQLRATFVAAPVIDAVTSRPTSAVYQARKHRYGLTPEGSQAMVADMMAFFSGVREPQFHFVNAYSPS